MNRRQRRLLQRQAAAQPTATGDQAMSHTTDQHTTELDAFLEDARTSLRVICAREYNKGHADGRASVPAPEPVSDRYGEGHAAGYRQGYDACKAEMALAKHAKTGMAMGRNKALEITRSKHFEPYLDKAAGLWLGSPGLEVPMLENEDPELLAAALRKFLTLKLGGRGDGTCAFTVSVLKTFDKTVLIVRRRGESKADEAPSQQQQQQAAAPAAAAAALAAP